jgi:outer membrane protein, multidrug efflux system
MAAKRSHASFALCVALALTGCATRVPQVLPASFERKAFTGTVDNAQESWPTPGWWRTFGSPELSTLIDRAQLNNQDIAVAVARMREAHAQVVIQRSVLLPQLKAQSDAERSNEPSSVYSGNHFELDNNLFSLNIEGTYVLDIWGLAQSNLRAASEALKAARFGEQAVRLNLTARVADSYFSVLTLRERIAITKGDIEAINALFDVIKLKVAAGKLSHLELAQEQAQLAVEQAQLPILEQQELESRVTLAVLIGQPPEEFDVDAAESAAVSPPAVNPGLPSNLLLRRPDVAQAEANLASVHANLDAARATFLPQFSLTGAGGYASGAIHALISGPNFIWSAAASVSQTIFAGGKLVGEKRLAQATQERLTASYRNAVLNAFADVEAALGQVRNYSLAEEYFRRAVDSAKEAFEVSQLQYRQGTADLITVLQTQQTLFGAKDQLVQVRLARIQGLIHLYQALGGGWVESESDRTQLMREVR